MMKLMMKLYKYTYAQNCKTVAHILILNTCIQHGKSNIKCI